MKRLSTIIFSIIITNLTFGQIESALPCSYEAVLKRNLQHNPNAEADLEESAFLLEQIIKERRERPQEKIDETYIIPVVMHVFHNGDDGKMNMEQALSGLEILNNDFHGLNDGWNSIDEAFDSIKGTLDIKFCLATIDPQGNPTTGLIYHEDANAMINQGNLFQHAWDNYKYLNIYFPKYTQGGPSDFTAFAYYPSTSNTEANRDGIFYSSIRWGFGNHSILEEGDDWASVCTHEAGHWLDLRHTFSSGCSGNGDFVDDTPPTVGSGLEFEGCDNNDFSCGVPTNGENYMDYNLRCKKMFTQGQIERMTAALYLPSRINLWTQENLIETGCINIETSTETFNSSNKYNAYPNPASTYLVFEFPDNASQINILNIQGQTLRTYTLNGTKKQIDTSNLDTGIYFYTIFTANGMESGRFVVR